jgi:hypothetical protein
MSNYNFSQYAKVLIGFANNLAIALMGYLAFQLLWSFSPSSSLNQHLEGGVQIVLLFMILIGLCLSSLINWVVFKGGMVKPFFIIYPIFLGFLNYFAILFLRESSPKALFFIVAVTFVIAYSYLLFVSSRKCVLLFKQKKFSKISIFDFIILMLVVLLAIQYVHWLN